MRTRIAIAVASILLFLLVIFGIIEYMKAAVLRDDNIAVLLVYNRNLIKKQPKIVEAYMSVLDEEGIPYALVDATELIAQKKRLFPKKPALIFPDGVNTTLPEDTRLWVRKYLEAGGNVFVAYDAGVRNRDGYFLERPVFSDILGTDYSNYRKLREKSYTKGRLKFVDESSLALFGITPGKTDEKLYLVSYGYDALQYPFSRSEILKNKGESKTLAVMIDDRGESFPAIVAKKTGNGNAVYVNLPLGHMKLQSDDLPLRSALRFFLLKTVQVPHVVGTPSGKGGIIINWHVDSNHDWKYIAFMKDNKYLREGLKYSFHITAGDYSEKEGDMKGFHVEREGGPLTRTLMPYGVIGSHGGWAHDWFASEVEKDRLGEDGTEKYIRMNNDALEKVTGYKIVEYSAPAGVHPQPVMTRIIERLGMIGYYYTGDAGSSPNRTYYNGRMVSNSVIAFPINQLGIAASLYEMKKQGRSDHDVRKWLTDLVDFASNNRVIRLFYSHPYNINEYPSAVSQFLDHCEKLQKEGKITVDTMGRYARFVRRFLHTTSTFRVDGGGMTVSLSNPGGLKEITVAIPKAHYKKPEAPIVGVSVEDGDGDYFYCIIEEAVEMKTMRFERR